MESQVYECYPGQERFSYMFYSHGPRGRILKKVNFILGKMQSAVVYNVSFGDVNGHTGKMDTDVVSDNADKNKVLLTVARIIMRFCRRYPQAYVFAQGSSAARNRLYQMMISSRLDEIQKQCKIYGILGSEIVAFQKNVNYDAFLMKAIGNVSFNKD
ncbi:hypothetical protein SAMN04488109_4759 [Chryseolinea serpens]|uniref:Uncharacterized protein n=1 Tax=Chryseolinea serpens TaxID=947013 RepID=A0A1M5UL94_9BACT|nr:hypothetical protein [Chryseolinea serpens]SHH63751.1 hypothetical protein SAMN04488109_4759 [Chryseolinea serpens]